MPVKKKKSNKTNKILNWLNPRTPAKKVLIFALVFAVIGGAYTAYKSSASSSVFNYANKIQLFNSSSQGVEQVDGHSKNISNPTVWRIEKNSAVTTTYKLFALSNYINVQFCVDYRFTVPTTNDQFYMMGLSYVKNGSYYYQKTCNPAVKYNLVLGTYNYVHASVTNYGPGDMYIYYMSIQW